MKQKISSIFARQPKLLTLGISFGLAFALSLALGSAFTIEKVEAYVIECVC